MQNAFKPSFNVTGSRYRELSSDTKSGYLDAQPCNSSPIFGSTQDASFLLEVRPDDKKPGWKTFNFEVAKHHTYVADGVRVHNTSTEYSLDANGRIESLISASGEEIAVSGSWTPSQLYHYGRVVDVENADGTTTPTVTSGGFFQNLSAAGRSFADLIGLDGRFGLQGTFSVPGEGWQGPLHEEGQPNPYRVDWSGDKDNGGQGDGVPDWRDEDYSNIGHWGFGLEGSSSLGTPENPNVQPGDRDGDGVPNWRDRDDGVGWIDKKLRDSGDTGGSGKPIILDMDGDGIEINVNGTVSFDMDSDGYLEQTSWVSPDDAFLVIDLNADGSRGTGDGRIDKTFELAFSEWLPTGGVTDLQALALFDVMADMGGNGDGVISVADTVYDELRVWQDLDQDGETDEDELKTLAQLGITRINLTYDDGTAYDDNRNDVSIFGNTLFGTASYTRNGEIIEGGVGDLSLAFNQLGYRRVDTSDGYRIELEQGENSIYREMDGTGSADVDLFADNLDGAFGDLRDNLLDASASEKAVQIFGDAGADTLLGGSQNDWIDGGDGADSLVGGDGNDVLFVDADDVVSGSVTGGGGIDTAIITASAGVSLNLGQASIEVALGGDGNDTLDGGNSYYDLSIQGRDGDDRLSGAHSDDVLSGDEGIDRLEGNAGDDLLLGGNGNDTIVGDGGDDLVMGGAGRDIVYAGLADDIAYGGAENDSLLGEAGDDYLSGEDGDDYANGGQGDDVVLGGDGNDTLSGDVGDDFLIGGDGHDVFYTGESDDIVQADTGNDIVYIEHDGLNYVFGGSGNDLVIFSGYQAYDFARVSFDSPEDGIVVLGQNHAGGWAMATIIKDVETVKWEGTDIAISNTDTATNILTRLRLDNLEENLTGSSTGNDTLSGGAFFDVLMGLGGGDKLYGRAGNDIITAGLDHDTAWGSSGSDTIEGDQGNDFGYGGPGSDFIYGGDGADELHGQAGADQVFGDAGNDTINGNEGNDVLAGGSGADELRGGSGSDILKGGSGNDFLNGNDGEDIVYGDSGHDTLNGGGGSDRLFGGADNDKLNGGWGRDWLYGGTGHDSLHAEFGDDYVEGGHGDDFIHGYEGQDALLGQAGSDWIDGGEDDDWIDGGFGSDDLFGRTGSDYLNTGSDIGEWQATSWSQASAGIWQGMKWQTGDFNGDGLDDVAVVFDSSGRASIDIHVSEDTAFSKERWATQEGGFSNDRHFLSGDFDGDGLDDLVSAFGSSGSTYLDSYLSSGTDFNRERWAEKQGAYWQGQKWLSGDFNGDGRTDVAKAFDHGGFVSLDVHLSTGTGFEAWRWGTQQGSFWEDQNWFSGDFNGDGLHDVVKVWSNSSTGFSVADVHVSNGSGFRMQRWLEVLTEDFVEVTWQAADVDGDGRDDLIQFGRNQSAQTFATVFFSESGGFVDSGGSQKISNHVSWQSLLMGDFTGDGLANITQIFDNQGWSANTHTLVAIDSNTLDGGTGNDTLESHAGDDFLTGGDGADVFRFVEEFGQNEITDFDVASPYEQVEFVNVSGITDFDDLAVDHLSQVGVNALIDDLEGNTILLRDVDSAALTVDDFSFLVEENTTQSSTSTPLNYAQTTYNLITNGSFEDSDTSLANSAPIGWTLGGATDSGGVTSQEERATDGDNIVALGGWSGSNGMTLSQSVVTEVGRQYLLSFDVGAVGSGAVNGNGRLLAQALSNGVEIASTSASRSASDGQESVHLSFVATDTVTAILFTDQSDMSDGNLDVDLDNVRLVVGEGNLLTNGSFEASDTSSTHVAPVGWTLAGVANSGGLYSQIERATDGDNLVVMGGWNGSSSGLTLSQTIATEIGETYLLSFDVGAYGSGAVNDNAAILAEAISEGTVVSSFSNLRSLSDGKETLFLEFEANSTQTTIRFTDQSDLSEGNLDLDLDNVWLEKGAGNLLINGSFEDSDTSDIHVAPIGWTIGGTENAGGLASRIHRATDGDNISVLGGWSDQNGMTLSQSFATTTGDSYILSFSVGVYGVGAIEDNARLLVEALSGNTRIADKTELRNFSDGYETLYLEFEATSNETTIRFTDQSDLQDGNIDIDLDDVRVVSFEADPLAVV